MSYTKIIYLVVLCSIMSVGAVAQARTAVCQCAIYGCGMHCKCHCNYCQKHAAQAKAGKTLSEKTIAAFLRFLRSPDVDEPQDTSQASLPSKCSLHWHSASPGCITDGDHRHEAQPQIRLTLSAACGCCSKTERTIHSTEWCPSMGATASLILPVSSDAIDYGADIWISISGRVLTPPG